MAGFANARTALAQLEVKLRRQLGLAGEIRAGFEPILTPVLIAGDLRDAGNAANEGRAFQFTHTGVPGANGFCAVRVEQDVFIDFLVASLSIAGFFECWVSVPGQNGAVAVATLQGTWVDRKVIAGDQVPLTAGVYGALTGTNVSDQNRIVGFQMQQAHVAVPLNVMLPAGSHFNWRMGGAAGTAWVNLRGRIWP